MFVRIFAVFFTAFLVVFPGFVREPLGLPVGAVDRLGLGLPITLAASPDGRFLAVASTIGVEIWDPQGLTLRQLLAPHEAWVVGLSFSPTGEELAAALSNGYLFLWSTTDWRELERLRLPGQITDLAWASEEILYVGVDNAVYTVNLVDRLSTKVLELPEDETIQSLALAPDGDLAVASDKRVRVFDMHVRKVRGELHLLGRRLLQYTKAGELIVGGPNLRILGGKTGEEIWAWQGEAQPISLAPDETKLVFASDSSLFVLDLITKDLEVIGPAHETDIVGLAFCGPRLYSLDFEGTWKVWDLAKRTPEKSMEELRGPVFSLALSPSGETLAMGTLYSVHLGDLESKEIRRLRRKFDRVIHLAFVGEYLAVVDSQSLALVGMETGALMRRKTGVRCLPEAWRFCAFSGDGAFFAFIDLESVLKELECCVIPVLRTQDLVHVTALRVERAQTLALDGQGNLLAIGKEKEIHVWALAEERIVRKLTGLDCTARYLVFSPSGKFLASWAKCDGLRVWDLSSEEVLMRLPEEDITCMTFAPDERKLAFGTSAGQVGLIDLSRPGQPKRVFHRHTAGVYALVFSPDGSRLFSGSLDGTVLVWDVQ